MALTDPSTIPGCSLWLDASDNSTLFQTDTGIGAVLNGDPVGQWLDKSSNNRHFLNANSSARPIFLASSYHNKPAIRFSNDINANCGLFSTFTKQYSSVTMFFVAATEDSGNGRVLYAHDTSSATNDSVWLYPAIKNGGRYYSYFHNNYRNYTSSYFSLCTFDVIHSSIDDNFNSRMGILGLDTPYAGYINTNDPYTVHAIGNAPIPANSSVFNGCVSEILIYNRFLTKDENHLVKRYLAHKWNCVVPSTYAVSNGNWSNPSIWIGGDLPLSSDNVFANGFTINIDQNIRVNSLRTSSHPLIAELGGSFVLNDIYQINAQFTGPATNYTSGIISGGKTTCLFNNVSAGTVNLSGNILSSNQYNLTIYPAQIGTVEHIGNSNLQIYGTVEPGNNQNHGIFHRSGGNIVVNGNVEITGRSYNTYVNAYGIYVSPGETGNVIINGNITHNVDRNNTTGILNQSDTSTVLINGDVYGGSRSGSYGIHNSLNGTVIVNGNVYGQSTTLTSQYNNAGIGIYNQHEGKVYINGDAYAIEYSQALVARSSGSTNIINGSVYNTTNGSGTNYQNGVQAVRARRYKINPLSTTTDMFSSNGTTIELHGPRYYTDTQLPAPSSVRNECLYGKILTGPNTFEMKGTMKIPPKELVLAGEIIGDELGTAVLSSDSLKHTWNYKIYDAISDDTIGGRVGKALTIKNFGSIVSSTNI